MDERDVFRPNFEKRDGLVTVIAIEASAPKPLMLAFTDEAGWQQTLETGLGSYYSTSRKKSWVKGETSGNFQKVSEMLIDCDGDALVYVVEPQGNGLACHTNARTCFYRSVVNGLLLPAPDAGLAEELQIVRTIVHPNFRARR